MYWNSIFWFLTWPALIIIAYQLIKVAVRKFEPVLEKEEAKEK